MLQVSNPNEQQYQVTLTFNVQPVQRTVLVLVDKVWCNAPVLHCTRQMLGVGAFEEAGVCHPWCESLAGFRRFL